VSIEIKGAQQLASLSKALKVAGEKELQQELSKSITHAMVPLRAAAKTSALTTLPRRGGLNRRVARSSMRTRRSQRGIRLEAKNEYALGQLDRGRVRHPVFGNRKVWVTQRVPPDWWTRPTDEAAPGVRAAISAAMDVVAAKIERSA
jgi:hypothetical protein